MTIEQAVRIVAERDGWADIHFNARKQGFGIPPGDIAPSKGSIPNYATSTDALRPVLAKLTGRERWKLHVALLVQWQTLPISRRPPNYTEWLLTIAPEQLCLAVAEAIEACKGKEKG